MKSTYLRTKKLEDGSFLAVSARSSFLDSWDFEGTKEFLQARETSVLDEAGGGHA